MGGIFFECKNLLFLPDISKWNTDNVVKMNGMFRDCTNLRELPDISKWNVNNVKDMRSMFNGCQSLSSFPDILKWNLNNSVNTENIFTNFSKTAIDSYKWNNYKTKFKFNPSLLDDLSANLVNRIFG